MFPGSILAWSRKCRTPSKRLARIPRTPISGWLTIGCSKRRGAGKSHLARIALHPEEVPRLVCQVTRLPLEAPSSQIGERDPLDVATLRSTPLMQPTAGRGDIGEATFPREGRREEPGWFRGLERLRPGHVVCGFSRTSRRYSSQFRTTWAGL